MVAQQRIEYHWIENRVVEKVIFRPRGTDKWHFNKYERTLVATIQESDRSFEVREGPAALPERIVDCIRLYKGVLVDDSIPDFTGRIPESVREELRAKLNEATSTIHQQFDSFAEETDITGFLKGEIGKIVIEREGWRIATKSWTYNRNPKENIIGADFGVVFDVLYGDERLIKVMWYQAKKVKGIPSSLDNIQDLAEQIAKMQQFTDEAYTLIYSPDVVITTRGLDANNFEPLSDNIVEGAICKRGDRNPLVIANTVDIKHVLDIFITGPKEQAAT